MALLEYNLTAVGEANIKRALSNIESWMAQHNAKMARMFGHPIGGVAGGAAMGQRAAHVAANDAKKMYGPGRREHAKAVDYRIKQDLKAEAASVKAHERAEKTKTRETEREAKKRERAIEAAARAEQRIQERAARQQAMHVRSGIKGMLGSAGSVLGSVGALGIGLTGLAGGAIVANALHGRMKLEAQATGLANQMVGEGASTDEIRTQRDAIVKQVNSIRGASSDAAVGSARAFGGISGNYGLGLKMAQDFTKISLATDVDLQDISRLAGNAYMKIKTPGMSEDEARKQTLEAVRTFAGQGNIGAVEIKDLAEYGGRLTAASRQFQGTRVENMAKMGTLAQVAVGSGSATDAAEATMAAARFASDLTEHADTVAALKINGKSISPFTDKSKTQFRGIDTLVADIMEGTGGNMSKMKDIFGERSYKMAQGFQGIYLDAEKQEKGSGRAAVLAEFEKFQKAAVSEKDVETRAAARLADEDIRLEMAMKELNSRIATSLTPAFGDLIKLTSDLIPVFAGMFGAIKDVSGWVADKLGLTKKNLGTEGSQDRQREEALAVAGEGAMTPYGRLNSAQARLDKARGELNSTPDSESIGALLSGTDTPTLKRYREAEKDVQRAAKELQQYEKNTAATEANTKAMAALSDVLRINVAAGGGATRAGATLPRGADGTSSGNEFY
jgi:hypothetical protein